MGAESFLLLLVSRIYRYEGLAFEGVDNEVIKLSDIISCICDKEGAFFKREKAF
jgi:hypothetical protein